MTPPESHPAIPARKLGVLLINLGTPDAADARTLGDLDLPRLSDVPDITVELIRSEADPGGVGELGVPAIGPAIANALQASTGYRIRNLPLLHGDE